MWLSLFIIVEIIVWVCFFLSFLFIRCDDLDLKTFGFLVAFFHILIYGIVGVIYLIEWIWSLNL